MNFLIEYFVSGQSFFSGSLMLILAAFISCRHEKLYLRIITGILFFVGMMFVIFSGVAIPVFLFIVMGLCLATLYFFTPFEGNGTRMFFWIARGVLVFSILAVFIPEMARVRMPVIEAREHKKMYVIGTGLSMNENSGHSYVEYLRDRYRMNIFNLSEPGNTAKKAISQADLIATDNIMILIELGMDEDYSEYAVFMDQLLSRLAGKNRTIMMFELPRLSTEGNFSQLQRQLAEKYQVKLIPKRILAAAIYNWGNRRNMQLTDQAHLWMANLLGPRLHSCVKKRNGVVAAPVIQEAETNDAAVGTPVPAVGAKR